MEDRITPYVVSFFLRMIHVPTINVHELKIHVNYSFIFFIQKYKGTAGICIQSAFFVIEIIKWAKFFIDRCLQHYFTLLCITVVKMTNFKNVRWTKYVSTMKYDTGFSWNHRWFTIFAESSPEIMHDARIVICAALIVYGRAPCILLKTVLLKQRIEKN